MRLLEDVHQRLYTPIPTPSGNRIRQGRVHLVSVDPPGSAHGSASPGIRHHPYDFSKFIPPPQNPPDPPVLIDEVTEYLEAPLVVVDDPLPYWYAEKLSGRWKNLARMALDILSTPGMSFVYLLNIIRPLTCQHCRYDQPSPLPLRSAILSRFFRPCHSCQRHLQ